MRLHLLCLTVWRLLVTPRQVSFPSRTCILFITGSAHILTVCSLRYYIFTAATIVIPWLYYNRPGASFPRVLSFFKTLRANEGASLPVGAAGFCWGGKHVCLLGHGATDDNGKPLMDAGFTAHPSMLSLPSDVEKLVRPVSFALAETDNQVSPAQGAQIEKIVGGKEGEAKGESIIYKGTGHGFSIRADLTHSDVAEQAKKAENQCISWFNKHFNIAE